MDALTHAIEGYACRLSEPITDAMGIYAIRMIADNLEKAVLQSDKEAKANMLMASLIAGISFSNSDVAAVHAMAEALGGMYDTPHGIANAILLPHVMEFNCDANTKKFAEIAAAMGEDIGGLAEADAARKSAEAVKRLSKALRIPNLRMSHSWNAKSQLLGNFRPNGIIFRDRGKNPTETVRKLNEENVLLEALFYQSQNVDLISIELSYRKDDEELTIDIHPYPGAFIWIKIPPLYYDIRFKENEIKALVNILSVLKEYFA